MKAPTSSMRSFSAASWPKTSVIFFVAIVLLGACQGSSGVSVEQSICERVHSLDENVLNETLTVEQINEELDLINQRLEDAETPLDDAVKEFVRAAREVMAGGFYEYPTFAPLNYLDTYEQMDLHVHAYESLSNVKARCRGISG